MFRFILKRLGISIIVVFLVTVFAFSLMHILPGDPARLVLGAEAAQADVDALREKLNLNKPILTQYFIWIDGILHGDFGDSIMYQRPVIDIMRERLPRTLAIGIPALIISMIFGVLFGVISAVKRGSVVDQAITFISTLGMGTPAFWLGILGIYVLQWNLRFCPFRAMCRQVKILADIFHMRSYPSYVCLLPLSLRYRDKPGQTCSRSLIRII